MRGRRKHGGGGGPAPGPGHLDRARPDRQATAAQTRAPGRVSPGGGSRQERGNRRVSATATPGTSNATPPTPRPSKPNHGRGDGSEAERPAAAGAPQLVPLASSPCPPGTPGRSSTPHPATRPHAGPATTRHDPRRNLRRHGDLSGPTLLDWRRLQWAGTLPGGGDRDRATWLTGCRHRMGYLAHADQRASDSVCGE